ncbi:MAG TPA: acyl-homoserine-lactone synthase [Steroidobacteraceae bacterium]|nr:acyl-homoserine-lactone synthase [Steroidobacteraceae bacterium]
MIFLVDAGNRPSFATDIGAMHRQRKVVFVDRAGWKVPVVADQEIDRFDLLEQTRYLIAKDEPHGSVLASARLLATSGPHLMQDLYGASHPATLPRGRNVWEASRFCTAPGIASRTRRLDLLGQIICGVMETAMALGIDQVIFAANRALLPLALHCGWDASIVGPTEKDGSDEFTPVAASMTAQGLRNVRDRYGIPTPIMFHSQHSPERERDPAVLLPGSGVTERVCAP